jgi:hypothetical protein
MKESRLRLTQKGRRFMLDEFQKNKIEVINLKEMTSKTELGQLTGPCKDQSTLNASTCTVDMKDMFKQSKNSLDVHHSSNTNLDTRKF